MREYSARNNFIGRANAFQAVQHIFGHKVIGEFLESSCLVSTRKADGEKVYLENTLSASAKPSLRKGDTASINVSGDKSCACLDVVT